jgi:hypothetical protein
VRFTPDGKWMVFRSNMHGASHVYAVRVAREADVGHSANNADQCCVQTSNRRHVENLSFDQFHAIW